MSTPIGGSLQYSNGMVQGPFPSGVLVKLTCATSTLQGHLNTFNILSIYA